MQTESDTIAAIATAAGEAGIAIVRVSGPQSLNIADSLFRGVGTKPSKQKEQTFRRIYLHGKQGDVDEVVLLVYRAPHSYTREDVVEFQGHGGRLCAQRILSAVLDAGARLAEPGEFTKRAFLNGRIDLLQAEAVADLIQAQTTRAASVALEQLNGSLTCWFKTCYDDLLALAADLEAGFDFPEEDILPVQKDEICQRLQQIRGKLNQLLETWGEGHVLREGARIVICGRPNVGKSTLLNHLLGTERAIVTNIPGTTRDVIEETLVLEGYLLRLVDTAGLRESECPIEQEGIGRAREYIEKADLILYVADATMPLTLEDQEHLKTIPAKRGMLVLNKIDQAQAGTAVAVPSDFSPPILCSALCGSGMDDLRRQIVKRLGLEPSAPPHASISERHKQIIQNALNKLNDAYLVVSEGDESSLVLAACTMREALDSIGTATGRVYSQEILDLVFSRFCIGK